MKNSDTMTNIKVPEWLPQRKFKMTIVQHDNGDIQIEYGPSCNEHSKWFEDNIRAINWLVEYFKSKRSYAQKQRDSGL